MNDLKIAFIGGGNMAASLIGGLLQQGLNAQQITACDINLAQREALTSQFAIATYETAAEAVAQANIVVLAVKPQVLKPVCMAIKKDIPSTALIVSIAAGINIASLENWLGKRAIVRCMPNTPALLKQGVSGLYANTLTSNTEKAQAEQLLSAVGIALWLDNEAQIDAVTAVSGSGPAYFFLLAQAMSQAGVKLGLSAETAHKLANQTALGAARMLCESEVDSAELRRRVTSPNGTTEAAINTFLTGGFIELTEKALTAASDRSAELAQQLGD
ncbi:pyrroline-5-carboxylate reductase [Pseudomonas sp. F1_0610]|uniref:pyrroline-5-carboxylate reductase n=1 Tax=Pseudomonas sp. F1_0610 TaxID=3114284 RepID=UPI0039C2E634